jgi:hypothetical protein
LNPVKLTLGVGTMTIYSGVVTSAAVGALSLVRPAELQGVGTAGRTPTRLSTSSKVPTALTRSRKPVDSGIRV